MAQERFYGTRPKVLPGVLPAGSMYRGRYRLLEPARAHATGQGRYDHVATFDILNCTTESGAPGAHTPAHTWGADAESVDWGTVLVPSAKQRACPSRHDDGSLCCHDAGHAGQHESQSTGNRLGWSDTRTPSGSQIMVAIRAGDTPKTIADSFAACIRAVRPDLDAVPPLSKQIGAAPAEGARLMGVAVKPSDVPSREYLADRITLGGIPVPVSPRYPPMALALPALPSLPDYSAQGVRTTQAADILTFYSYDELVAQFGKTFSNPYREAFFRGAAFVRVLRPAGSGEIGFTVTKVEDKPTKGVPCRGCSSPATKSAWCAYCFNRDGEDENIDEMARQRTDEKPGQVAARARNEAALAAEKPRATKSSREAALPHPWEAWSVPGADS